MEHLMGKIEITQMFTSKEGLKKLWFIHAIDNYTAIIKIKVDQEIMK